MLKINSQLFAIEDTLDDLAAAFLNLEVVRTYKA
ncbi:MAG: YlbF family regulator, partial [Streptococcus mutans]